MALQGVGGGVGTTVSLFSKLKGFIPMFLVGIFLIGEFLWNLITHSFPYAFEQLAKATFAAELTINENVQLAILNAPEYNLWSFLQIVIAVYIIYLIVKFFTMVQVKLAGATAQWGAMLISVLFVGIIEISMVRIIDGQFGFIPIWNGIIFLLLNIVPVFANIFGPSSSIIVEKVGQNISNMTKV